ncbi:MCP methyltransferase, CheR-type [Bryocella elongata]|uniref:protein-glutamate O-methyltransferase n=2 Tax=Bryocella elongata TaxID=863522 RepID=A0A1H5ZL12_9BACT|nr:MCP methyltransferase, CheR-type [Bryocella elongata]
MGALGVAHEDRLTRRDFDRVRELVREQCGIQLGPDKHTMVEVRLKRRLRALGHATYTDYCAHLFESRSKAELVSLIDVITTNKTDFFRESNHFDFLTERVLPELNRRAAPMLIWSAACSSGEEPYTMAMVLSEFAEKHESFRFSILATDISTEVLERAETAVYTKQVVEPISASMQRKYLMRSRDRSNDRVRIVPELRSKVEFRRLNFMDEAYGLPVAPQVIFCRNALIYFDRVTQESIVRKLIRELEPGGYLFIGHSETLSQMDLPVTAVASTIYRKI